jgi:two-component system, NtrC family, response regulator AtoC
MSLSGLSVLVIEDDLLLRKQVTAQLERSGADVVGAGGLGEARRWLKELDFDFALLDIQLPDGSGLELLRSRGFPAGLGVIVMTGESAVGTAVEAMRLGAVDYVAKPFELDELPLVIERARRDRQRTRLNEHRRRRSDGVADFFFGRSLSELERLLQKILDADVRMQTHLPPVLIQGETGTGKTTVARWLHHRGPRSEGPLVEMNCSALPETLAESELFGHERGAFTDARATRIGLFEAADGGTLLLDELPSLSASLQAKVLKVLEDHRIRRVGGRKEIPVDVRVVAATSVDLRERAARGEFREDLVHRLDLYRVLLPPLRDRGDDLVELAERLLAQLCVKHRVGARQLGPVGQARLRTHRWPGNVRELTHELERALVFEERGELELEALSKVTWAGGAGAVTARSGAVPIGSDWLNPDYVFPAQGFQLEAAIGRLIQRALEQSEQNVSAAARLLGVSRDYIRYRLGERKKDAERVGDEAQGGRDDLGGGSQEG